MTAADQIAAVFQDAQLIFEENFYADEYVIERPTAVSDGRGGTTETRITVEGGRCSLNIAGRTGGEQMRADQVQARSLLECELPPWTSLTERDTLIVNGRRYHVNDVARGGYFDTAVMADVEEIT